MTDNKARATLAKRERAHRERLAVAYRDILADLTAELAAITDDIAIQRAGGGDLDVEWLYRQRRYRQLLTEAEARFATFARSTAVTVTDSQRAAIIQAAQDADRAIAAELVPSPPGVVLRRAVLPVDALDHLVANLAPDSPLSRVLSEFPDQASMALRRELVTGLAAGRNPVAIAERAREALGAMFGRAMVILRTETMRAYRQATIDVFRANANLLEGWVWKASLSVRTCAACWAMHGSLHPLNEPFSGHPQCRCVASPRTRSWADLGHPNVSDTRKKLVGGEALFARRKPKDQLAVLGKPAHDAYQAGEVRLGDFVKVRHSKTWGDTRTVTSLDDARATARARTPIAAPSSPKARQQRPAPFAYDPDAFVDYRDKQFAAWRKRATPGEVSAIERYKNADYRPINYYLRTGTTARNNAAELQKNVDLIDAGLRKAILDMDVTVTRGFAFDPRDVPLDWQAVNTGSVIRDKGYMSTSTGASSEDFTSLGAGGYLLEIDVRKGSSGLYIDPLGLSEDEVLLPRDSAILVKRIVREKSGLMRIFAELVT